MSLAQEYFGESAEALKQQIKENRATLDSLPDQVPGGRDEAFQTLFQELMDNYSTMEESIEEAQKNVANLNMDQIRRQGEIDATDAARREAKERGVDLTQVEGTGSDGRIIVSDVVEAAEAMEEEGGPASQAAQQAQETVGGLAGGQQGGGPLGGVTDQVGQVAQGVQDTAGGAAQQAQDAAGQAAGQAQEAAGQVAGQAQDVAGGAVQQAQDTAGQAQQAAGGDGAEEPRATNAARRRAEQLGLDLSTIQGTGSGGLITIRDVTGS